MNPMDFLLVPDFNNTASLSVMLWFVILLAGMFFLALIVSEGKRIATQKILESRSKVMRMLNHQLTTPLSIMQNAYTMVSDGSLDEKKGFEYWAIGLKRMGLAMEDLQDFLRSEKEFLPDIQKTDISGMVNEIASDRQKSLRLLGKDVAFTVKQPDFTIPHVLCDAKQIQVVLYNLFDNAIAYTQKGSIAVSYRLVANKYLAINVEDTGIGFSKQEANHIGHECYRTPKALSLRPEGSGLGVSICRHIMEINKGKLTYVSAGEGKGSVFSITLPIAK